MIDLTIHTKQIRSNQVLQGFQKSFGLNKMQNRFQAVLIVCIMLKYTVQSAKT